MLIELSLFGLSGGITRDLDTCAIIPPRSNVIMESIFVQHFVWIIANSLQFVVPQYTILFHLRIWRTSQVSKAVWFKFMLLGLLGSHAQVYIGAAPMIDDAALKSVASVVEIESGRGTTRQIVARLAPFVSPSS